MGLKESMHVEVYVNVRVYEKETEKGVQVKDLLEDFIYPNT